MLTVPRRYPVMWIALTTIVVVTALYALAYQQRGAFPAASSLVGHGIGIVGFVLMLMTETLYSIRKLQTTAGLGNLAGWLRFHMVTGLVGPYMVLLHTSMRFSGLAGVAMLLTVVVVISGLVGRYLYAGTGRTSEGAGALYPAEPAAAAGVDRTIEHAEARRGALATWYSFHVPLTWALFLTALVHAGGALYYATFQR